MTEQFTVAADAGTGEDGDPAGADGGQAVLERAQRTVQTQATRARSTLADQVRDQVATRSTQAGRQISALSDAMRAAGASLREGQQGVAGGADLVDQAADRAAQLGNYLTRSGPDQILGDLEDLGRRQPWLVVAAGVTAGLVAARFLKASGRRRYNARFREPMEPSGGYPAVTGSAPSIGPAIDPFPGSSGTGPSTDPLTGSPTSGPGVDPLLAPTPPAAVTGETERFAPHGATAEDPQ